MSLKVVVAQKALLRGSKDKIMPKMRSNDFRCLFFRDITLLETYNGALFCMITLFATCRNAFFFLIITSAELVTTPISRNYAIRNMLQRPFPFHYAITGRTNAF